MAILALVPRSAVRSFPSPREAGPSGYDRSARAGRSPERAGRSPEHADPKGGARCPGSQVPRREAMLEQKPRGNGVLIEVGQSVAAVGAKAHDDDAVGADVRADVGQDGTLGAGSDEGHHVASHDGRVERLRVADGG